MVELSIKLWWGCIMDDQKWLSIGDELIKSVKDKFPLYAEISSIIDRDRRGYVARIHWRLGSDKERPNKSSRIILVIISGEAIDDSHYDSRRNEVHAKFEKFIDSKIKQFNPEHDESYNKLPPVDEWLVDNACIN